MLTVALCSGKVGEANEVASRWEGRVTHHDSARLLPTLELAWTRGAPFSNCAFHLQRVRFLLCGRNVTPILICSIWTTSWV